MQPGFPSPFSPRRPQRARQFESLQATELFCSQCRASMPVYEKLLLALPSGDVYHYVCKRCGSTLGKKT